MSNDKAYVHDNIESFELAISYLGAQSAEQLGADTRNLDAIVRRIEIVGEATKRLSPAIRQANPQLPWREMAGMRDRVIHGYDRVDVQRVFDTVAHRMPSLIDDLRRLRDNLPDPD